MVDRVSGYESNSCATEYFLKQSDLDGDQIIDVTEIYCSWITSGDKVSVFDGKLDMVAAKTWKEATDFRNDTWVFDSGGDGTAQLIIRFVESDQGNPTAHLYDDQDGDGKVDYRVDGKVVEIREADSWTVKVSTEQNWMLDSSKVNQNLRIFWWGHEDIAWGIKDGDLDGIADYEYWWASKDSLPDRAANQPGVWVNHNSMIPQLPENRFFWPLLVAGDWPNIQNAFDVFPFIVVDFATGSIQGTSIGKDSAGYPTEEGYFILPTGPLTLGEMNYMNFENPMAYYDLVGDRDGLPELMVRMEYFGPLDPDLDAGPSNLALNDIRYSWNQDNSSDLVWDYKIGLAGSHEIDSEVYLDDFGLETIPYEELPGWITQQTWAWGSLIVNEGGGYPSTEGIYEWSATNVVQGDISDAETIMTGSQEIQRNYLLGKSSEAVDQLYSNVRPGMRGEFGYLNDRPVLYYSPIDGRLHLRHALKGVWNLGDGREIRYANRDGDPYFEEWRFLDNGSLQQQLIQAQDYLIYSAEDDISIKQVKLCQTEFEVTPPTTREEWTALNGVLEENYQDFPPDNFQSVFSEFNGPATQIHSANIDGYRKTGDGFRFILELLPDYEIVQDDLDLNAGNLQPGAYLITYSSGGNESVNIDEGGFHLQPLTSPVLSVEIERSDQGPSSTLFSDEKTMRIRLSNLGLEDAQEVIGTLNAFNPGREIAWTDTFTVTVPAGESVVHWVNWTPAGPGEWIIRTSAELHNQRSTSPAVSSVQTEQSIFVDEAVELDFWQQVTGGGLVKIEQVLLLIAAIIILGSVAGWNLIDALTEQHK